MPRPALVVQDDRFDGTDSVTGFPFTTNELDAPLLRVPVVADEANGLSQDSCLMVDKITTVRRSNAHGARKARSDDVGGVRAATARLSRLRSLEGAWLTLQALIDHRRGGRLTLWILGTATTDQPETSTSAE